MSDINKPVDPIWSVACMPWCGCEKCVSRRVDAIAKAAGEAVDHPPHYSRFAPHEPVDVIERWGLGFFLGNVVKYIARADHKGSAVEDLKKARWYLDREIAKRGGR